MYRFFNDRSAPQKLPQEFGNEPEYDEFQGRIILVDLASIDGQTEEFEGRTWLEAKVRDKLPVGWDLEWQPDRTKESDNPIALMQFSDEHTALLIRTHQTRQWLPGAVMRALLDEGCVKVGVGWDGPDKQKMQSTFNFQPLGIYDLAEVAKKKGLKEQGLKSLTDHFGFKMKKDTRIARTNWAQPQLTQEQVRYAAEDAYFAYLLYEKLKCLPEIVHAEAEGYEKVNQGVLELQPGWEEQGICRKHDGLWCMLCDKGPMTVPMVVERHMQGQKHRKKTELKQGLVNGPDTPEELAEEYLMQGIIAGTGFNDLKVGDYRCMLCDAGPFNTLQMVDVHLRSKKHQKAIAPPPEPTPEPTPVPEVEVKKDPFEDGMWNLPDYVVKEDMMLVCTLCQAKAHDLNLMHMHLGGDRHAKKCRNGNCDEIIYIKENRRLEVLRTGQPVVRTGFRVPQPADKAVSTTASTAEGAGAATSKPAAAPLPDGWEEFIDATSDCSYYWNAEFKVSQWERPQLPPFAGQLPPGRQAASQRERPQSLPLDEQLPPGWQVVWCEYSKKHYYADVETQASQWDPPQQYFHYEWRRQVDPEGRAFWACSQLNVSFYEVGDSSWQRLMDQKQAIYWSNPEMGIRFFEDPPSWAA